MNRSFYSMTPMAKKKKKSVLNSPLKTSKSGIKTGTAKKRNTMYGGLYATGSKSVYGGPFMSRTNTTKSFKPMQSTWSRPSFNSNISSNRFSNNGSSIGSREYAKANAQRYNNYIRTS